MLFLIYGSIENLHDSKKKRKQSFEEGIINSKKRKLPQSSVLQGKTKHAYY
jgi:hypothetical protein